jgi:hypothetical protein
MASLASPAHRTVMNDSPVVDFDDVFIGETAACRLANLAERTDNGNNGLKQLVFHGKPPLGSA